jgi:hypothetical protein
MTLKFSMIVMAFSSCIFGCSGNDGFKEDYSKEIKMTPEQETKMKEDMANNPAPGAIGKGGATPGTMKVPGKGK